MAPDVNAECVGGDGKAGIELTTGESSVSNTLRVGLPALSSSAKLSVSVPAAGMEKPKLERSDSMSMSEMAELEKVDFMLVV